MSLHPLASKRVPASALVDVPRLVAAYYTVAPDMAMSGQRVAFGTSAHRGSSLTASFNETHILAVTQAVCEHRAQRRIGLRDRFDLAFAADPDADRHGIVSRAAGLLNPNHYLAVAIDYLFRHRPQWPAGAAVGKTVVSSALIDRVARRLGRQVHEVPVGLKWFVTGLLEGSLGFAGEESAGASFLRRDGAVWTTDKGGILLDLLAAEITARTGREPGEAYRTLTEELGESAYARIDAPATIPHKAALMRISAEQVRARTLAGELITNVLTTTRARQAVGGIKVTTRSGWFAARPSGTEPVYKLYAESFACPDHLQQIQSEARAIIAGALAESH